MATRQTGTRRVRINCDQCSALMINGVFCHETGCPNERSRYDAESQTWIRQRECFDCGYTVDVDDPCCSAFDAGDDSIDAIDSRRQDEEANG